MQATSITAATSSITTILSHARLSVPSPPRRTAISFRPRRISCEVAVTLGDVSSSVSTYSDEETRALGKVGARVRVKVPLTVYHIPRVPELQMEGMEGVVKQYVVIWKGKRISANFPFKVEFLVEGGVRERPATFKFFAHLREDELEWVE